jgi:hypothetical protein
MSESDLKVIKVKMVNQAKKDTPQTRKHEKCLWFWNMKVWMKFMIVEVAILILQAIVTPIAYNWGHWSQEYLEQVVGEDWEKPAITDV